MFNNKKIQELENRIHLLEEPYLYEIGEVYKSRSDKFVITDRELKDGLFKKYTIYVYKSKTRFSVT